MAAFVGKVQVFDFQNVVIVISSELTELIGLADRIVVLREGRLTGEVLREQATEAKLLGYAMANNG